MEGVGSDERVNPDNRLSCVLAAAAKELPLVTSTSMLGTLGTALGWDGEGC